MEWEVKEKRNQREMRSQRETKCDARELFFFFCSKEREKLERIYKPTYRVYTQLAWLLAIFVSRFRLTSALRALVKVTKISRFILEITIC